MDAKMPSSEVDVLIVGAGLAGLMMANLLTVHAAPRIETSLFDLHEIFRPFDGLTHNKDGTIGRYTSTTIYPLGTTYLQGLPEDLTDHDENTAALCCIPT